MKRQIRPAEIQQPLLKWFRTHKRVLPWRSEPRDPYRVWLSEVMLQQTQVATVVPYYKRWLLRFPTITDLARAPLDDVLKQWEGLGYYSRARNLHRAAQVVVSDYGGRIPDTVDELLRLPGVGRYTAGAVASLAYGRRAPILDGNVTRVLSRVFARAGDTRAADTVADLWRLSEWLLPRRRASEFNEALMDLGATVCRPRSPTCTDCPLSAVCIAYAKGKPEAYPIKSAKRPLPHKNIVTAVIFDTQGRVLLAQRAPHGLLGGLWEFPGGDIGDISGLPGLSSIGNLGTAAARMGAQLGTIILNQTGLRIAVGDADFIGRIKHAFTHFRITRHIAVARLSDPIVSASHSLTLSPGGEHHSALRWVTSDEIQTLALTRSDQKIASLAFHNNGGQPHLL